MVHGNLLPEYAKPILVIDHAVYLSGGIATGELHPFRAYRALHRLVASRDSEA